MKEDGTKTGEKKKKKSKKSFRKKISMISHLIMRIKWKYERKKRKRNNPLLQ